jgi:hypothetical protein
MPSLVPLLPAQTNLAFRHTQCSERNYPTRLGEPIWSTYLEAVCHCRQEMHIAANRRRFSLSVPSTNLLKTSLRCSTLDASPKRRKDFRITFEAGTNRKEYGSLPLRLGLVHRFEIVGVGRAITGDLDDYRLGASLGEMIVSTRLRVHAAPRKRL